MQYQLYAVLAIVSNSYPPLPGRLPTRYSPVRNSSAEAKPPSAFYLHVLGTPPAFVLSQDQTLIKKLFVLNSFLSLTDLLFFYCSVTITLVIAPCTLVQHRAAKSSLKYSSNSRNVFITPLQLFGRLSKKFFVSTDSISKHDQNCKVEDSLHTLRFWMTNSSKPKQIMA